MKIAIASGKGGTGKTTVATAIACSLNGVTYIDLDVEEPNGALILKPEIEKIIEAKVWIPDFNVDMCTFCEKCSEKCRFNALLVIPKKKTIKIFNELCHSCKVCQTVCPSSAIIQGEKKIGVIREGKFNGNKFIDGYLNIGEAMSPPLISIVKKSINGDGDNIKIIDCPPGTSCPLIEALKGVDFCVLVAEPTPFSLSDLKITVDVVKEMKIPFGVVINKAGTENKEIYDYCKNERIDILLEIKFDLKIAKRIARGNIFLNSPRDKPIFNNMIGIISKLIRNDNEKNSNCQR